MRANQVVRCALATASHNIKNAQAARRVMRERQGYVEALVNIVLFILKECGVRQHTWVVAGTKPYVTFMLEDLNSFKNPGLTKSLEVIGALMSAEPTSDDYAESRNRTFSYENEFISVRVSAYIDSQSGSCKRVEVGRSQQEVVQYRMVCD